MKGFHYGVALALTAALTTPALAEDYDICVNATDFAGGFSPGDGITAVGIIVPGGTIPTDGVGVASCDDIADRRIGTFFAKGHVVAGLPNAAANNDLAYVDWQFRIEEGKQTGAIDTSGPIPDAAALPPLATYPHTIVGASGGLAPAKGEILTTILGAGGFQIRISVPGNSGKGN
jgi:hypothetical protein